MCNSFGIHRWVCFFLFILNYWGWFLLSHSHCNLLPAVNRQPWFPRGKTRTEGSACPPAGPCVRSRALAIPVMPEASPCGIIKVLEQMKFDFIKKPCKIRCLYLKESASKANIFFALGRFCTG